MPHAKMIYVAAAVCCTLLLLYQTPTLLKSSPRFAQKTYILSQFGVDVSPHTSNGNISDRVPTHSSTSEQPTQRTNIQHDSAADVSAHTTNQKTLDHMPTLTRSSPKSTRKTTILSGAPTDVSPHPPNETISVTVGDTAGRKYTVCDNVSVPKAWCDNVSKHSVTITPRFPLQFITGAPGSGNDWILWLASLNQDRSCEIYLRVVYRGNPQIVYNSMKKYTSKPLQCLFLKSHEPWFASHNSVYTSSKKIALLFRHPYDAAFAEYKRKQVEYKVKQQQIKNSVAGIALYQFFNPVSNTTNPNYLKWLNGYTQHWAAHMRYWLTTYTGPLHVMIYKNVKADTVREIEELQRYFGYQFNDAHLRDHCCKMNQTTNLELKRKPSVVDAYKERIYNSIGKVRQKFEELVKETNTLLAERYPDRNLILERG